MYFETLQGRLLDCIKWRVRNGELTERRLAGLVGISQPHMHNILKGVRALSPETADRILKTLEMSVLDLFVAEHAPGQGILPPRRDMLSNSPAGRKDGQAVHGLKRGCGSGPLPGKCPGPAGLSGPN